MKLGWIGFFLVVIVIAGAVFALPKFRPRDTVPWDRVQSLAPGSFVQSGEFRTHFIEKGQGEPIILIHGFLFHTVMWRGTQEALATSFRTLAVDLYGWGYSTRIPGAPYSYGIYAQQVLDFMDAMGIPSAHLIGQSMGGGTAMMVAAQWPERVNKLVLVDAAGLPNPLPLTAKAFGAPKLGEFLVALPGRALFRRNIQDFWFYDQNKVTDDYVDAVIAPMSIKGSSESILGILRKMDFGGLTETVNTLAGHRKPVLIVWGRQDRAVPLALGEKLNVLLPNSRMLVVDNAGHSPHEEDPDQVNPAMRDFLLTP
ncbi:MAG: alpha/beta fold hydrolase [Nitrospirae bacterium]|nr:alpha/beta fold hydrolase [Nitrospirota bacterium]